jgi:hypothetical protein
MAPPLHPAVEPLGFLLGTWRGEGSGGYPTVEPFVYGERIVFDHVGDEFLMYEMESWSLADDRAPLHLERGFLRPGAEPDTVELTLAHPLGLTEISEGRVDGTSLELSATAVARTPTGSAVVGLLRRYRVDGDVMTYEIDMAMEATSLTRHLDGQLRRAPG